HRLGRRGRLPRLGRQRGGARRRMDARARARRRRPPRRDPRAAGRPRAGPELPRRDEPDGAARAPGDLVVKAVHYLNQFFAGLGGEEAAATEPLRLEGAVGPGRGLAAQLEGVEIAATVACGDDFFGEHEDEALERLLGLIAAEKSALLVAGPAFGSGRYG